MRRTLLLLSLPAGLLFLALPTRPVAREPASQEGTSAPRGPFGLSRVTTEDGKPVAIEGFGVMEDCSLCHERQVEEFEGSFHSRSHLDPLYRAFAELALKEAGPEIYALCAGCHTPAGVVAGLVPGTSEEDLPEAVLAGVQCDVCHQVRALNGTQGPWGEPGNASFVLQPGDAKTSIHAAIQANPGHTAQRAEFLGKSEFCASCHTVIHPMNGLRVEHTYAEWKESVYAENGIQCQDCHMRTVEDAIEVARTLRPVTVIGRTSGMSAQDREIHPHWFVGGNADAELLTGSATHAAMAEARLKSAAEVALEAPAAVAPGSTLAVQVAVTNVGAGHALPTSLTELRELWIQLEVRDARGTLLFESGALDAHGELGPGTLRFGMQLLDAAGRPTWKMWEAQSVGWKRLVPPKGTERETFQVPLPDGTTGPLALEARLLYRIAPPHVVRAVMGERAFEPRIVEMARTNARVDLR